VSNANRDKLLRYFDIDRPVAYALAMRCWQFPAGLVTAILIALCFSPELQGYFYTISTLVALQTFVDLGLPVVVLHVASHEWPALRRSADGEVAGDQVALERLAGLVLFSTRWFTGAAGIFVVVAGGAGLWLFGRESHDVVWLLPLCAVILLAAVSVALSPRIATLEGCQQVLAVNRTRFFQAVTGSVAVWVAMWTGAGLWTIVVASAVQLAWELHLVWGAYRSFFQSLARVVPRLGWHREVWPLQWRMGVQSVVRYFAFYLFTPVMFAAHGAEVAGRMGMTWSVLLNIQLAAFVWVRTRAPRYGELIARREFAQLDRDFFRGMTVSLAAILAALAALVLVLASLANSSVHAFTSLAGRFLEPSTVLVFGAGLIPIHIAQCLSVYLRSHKQDPLLGVMVLSNTLIGLAVFWFGSRSGPLAAGWGFTAVATLVTMPGVAWIWFVSRRHWHALPAPPIGTGKLRIGLCLSLYWPIESGAERQARRHAHELVRRGHQVTVYTRRLAGHPVYERDGEVHIRRVIRTWDVGPLFGLTFLASLAWHLWRDRKQLDLVHCHQAFWEAVAAGWIHRRTGLATVIQPANSGPYGEVQTMSRVRGKRLARTLILANTHFVAISQQIEQELRTWGVPKEQLDRFASGIDVDEFAPGPSALESQLPPRPRVIFLGRLHPQKNLVVLLQAWQRVRERVPAAHLLLVGDGPQRQELEELAATLRVQRSVHFLGAQRDPLPYLQAADLFVLPSISEGMSNSLLEAMACGVPCVVSAAGGNVDLVRDGQAGLMADAQRAADVADQLVRMLEDPTLRQRCGRRARQIVCEEYSIRSIVDRYEALYRRLVARRGG